MSTIKHIMLAFYRQSRPNSQFYGFVLTLISLNYSISIFSDLSLKITWICIIKITAFLNFTVFFHLVSGYHGYTSGNNIIERLLWSPSEF